MTDRILVVDDEVSIRTLLTRILGSEGYEVLSAATGREGLEIAFKGRPDLIILDLNLPDLYGEDICKSIRQNSAIESTPVLILTGKSAEGLPARCLNGGADDYIAKPCQPKLIVEKIKHWINESSGRTTKAA